MRSITIANTIVIILVFWLGLTIWTQYAGKAKVTSLGHAHASKRALIIYNPDPIYNLDEQVCNSFASGLIPHDFKIDIATAKSIKEDIYDYDLYLFCSNTYNWAPDWYIEKVIKTQPNLAGKNVVAITLGSGSTARAKRLLDDMLLNANAVLLDSRTYWLMRPNDENKMHEENAKIATDQAYQFGDEIGRRLNTESSQERNVSFYK